MLISTSARKPAVLTSRTQLVTSYLLKENGVGSVSAQVKGVAAQVWKRNGHLVRSVLAVVYLVIALWVIPGSKRCCKPSISRQFFKCKLLVNEAYTWETPFRNWLTLSLGKTLSALLCGLDSTLWICIPGKASQWGLSYPDPGRWLSGRCKNTLPAAR
jgi:hypothetical protein